MFDSLKAETEAEIAVPAVPTAPVVVPVPAASTAPAASTEPAVLKADVVSSTAPTTNTMVERTSNPPRNCQDGGVWGKAKYVGEKTKAIACLGCLCLGCLGCCVLLCPQDEMDAYCVQGKVYNAGGEFLFNKDSNNFIPSRRS